MTTETKERVATSVAPFGIEAKTSTNSNLMVQSVPNCRLRTAISPIKTVTARDEDGEQVLKPVPANIIEGIPANVPGMQLHVNPKTRQVKIIDPLYKNEDILEKIAKAMKRAGVGTGKLRGVPPREETMGVDEMKTLIRELRNIVMSGDAVVVKGVLPDQEDIDELPGDYLLSPNNSSKWNQPRYEKDLAAWTQKLNRLGG